MPPNEIGDVARIVSRLRKALIGKTVASVTLAPNVRPKLRHMPIHTFQKKLVDKQINDIGQKGTNYWLQMSSSPHPLIMSTTGRIYIKGQPPYSYQWPPEFCIFIIETKPAPNKIELAFVDPASSSRMQLVNSTVKMLRRTGPNKETGPDPVIDTNLFTPDYFKKLLKNKKACIKSLLCNEKYIGGIGDVLGDEILYGARIHPAQIASTLDSAQVERLYKSISYVCQDAVDVLGFPKRYPKHWLSHFGRREYPITADGEVQRPLFNGNETRFILLNGRVSLYIPALQKRTDLKEGMYEYYEEVDGYEIDVEPEEDNLEMGPTRSRRLKRRRRPDEETEMLPETDQDVTDESTVVGEAGLKLEKYATAKGFGAIWMKDSQERKDLRPHEETEAVWPETDQHVTGETIVARRGYAYKAGKTLWQERVANPRSVQPVREKAGFAIRKHESNKGVGDEWKAKLKERKRFVLGL